MNKSEILEYLKTTDQKAIRELFTKADQIRQEYLGDGIYLRGIIEFSNTCKNTCAYCGLNKNNKKLTRYTLTIEEIMGSVDLIVQNNIQTVVLQSGEDTDTSTSWLTKLIKLIKSKYPDLAITLSVGERSKQDYLKWFDAGADRYLLKIETTNSKLYTKLHPGMSFENRLDCLENLEKIGYQVGSGIIVGLREQTLEILANDILFFAEHDFDMIGIGPFIPHQETELGQEQKGNVELTLKVIALTRIVTKNSHLPATTALGSMDKDYRPEALKAGANVLMPNFTPLQYKPLYEIYPEKRCITEKPGACAGCMEAMAKSVGRTIDYSRGDSKKTS